MQGGLVLGYGNELRRDDGAGPQVAREVAALGLAGVEVVEAHQLLPEHAEVLARFARVVFVDASVDEPVLGLRRVTPSRDAALAPHASDPAAIVALAGALFGHAPDAWMVTLPATDLGIGEGLSAETAALVPQAVAEVIRLLEGGEAGERPAI